MVMATSSKLPKICVSKIEIRLISKIEVDADNVSFRWSLADV